MHFPGLLSYSRYASVLKMLGFVGVLAAILNISPTQPAQADDAGYDLYPWINTSYITVSKSGSSYTVADSYFIADHFDEAVAKLSIPNNIIKQRNPRIKLYSFTGLAYIYGGDLFGTFLAENPGHTDQEIEEMYIHYKCDVSLHDTIIPGCNLVDIQTGQCSGTPATGCSASSALALSESRVPESYYPVFLAGWRMPNYNSALYKDYGVWSIRQGIDLYGDANPVEGIFWDNILYLGSHEIDKTIEYWGDADTGLDHPRNDDYHAFFEEVETRVEQEEGRSLVWYGNFNNMWWVRAETPHDEWVLSHLTNATSESWISPINNGERAMPFWAAGCSEMKEAWDYSANHGLNLSVLTYNYPFGGAYENPDQRTKVFSMVKFYLVNNDHLYYGYSEDDLVTSMSNVWNQMAEINIGYPKINPAGVKDFDGLTGTNKFFDWNNQTTQLNCLYYEWDNIVMARHYDNGMVIARWKGARWQTGTPPADDPVYNSYVDPRVYSIANPFQSEYYIVEPDGTLSDTIVSSVTLRTNEAAMLLQVCEAGPVLSTCGCDGLVLNAGDTCVPNSQPTIAPIDDLTLTENKLQDLLVTATDPDCGNGQCISFNFSGSVSQAFASITNHGNGTATVHLTPGYGDAGVYNLSVVASDDGIPVLTDTASFVLTVIDQPHPPIIAEIADKQIHEQELLEFNIVATDPKTREFITLTAINLPIGAQFTDLENWTGHFQWTPTAEQSGLYENIQFIATDSDGATDTEVVAIRVLDGVADCTPSWDCSDWSVCANSIQTRSCHDNNLCGSDAGRPVETAGCDSTAPGVVTDLVAS